MSQSSRDVKKRLFEFAKNEFLTKSPKYVEVRKAKGAKTFYKGPVPQLILTKYKAIIFTVFANYGSLSRLYYFNREGYCIKDTSYSIESMSKIKNHLKKTTTRVLRYPKEVIKESTSTLSVDLDKRFANIIERIEKITKKKFKSRPIITIDKKVDSTNFGDTLESINQNENFLEVPFGKEKDAGIEILLVYEAFKTTINSIVKFPELSKQLAMIGTLLYIEDSELLNKAIELCGPGSKKINLHQSASKIKFAEIVTLYNFIDALKNYIVYDSIFSSSESISILKESFLHNLFTTFDGYYRLAIFVNNLLTKQIQKGDEYYHELLLSLGCLEIISETQSESFATKIERAKKSKADNKGNVTQELLDSIYNNEVRNTAEKWQREYDLFSTKMDNLMDLVITKMFKKAILLKTEYTTDQANKPGDIILKFQNNSDTNLGTFTVSELRWTPRESMIIIGESRRLKKAFLEKGEEVKLRIPILPKKIGTINFTNLDIRFNDHSSERHYIRLPLQPLKIKKMS